MYVYFMENTTHSFGRHFVSVVAARVVFLRAVIRELRQAGAVSDESIMEAVKLVKSRIKNDAA